jgi:hypothetical protein
MYVRSAKYVLIRHAYFKNKKILFAVGSRLNNEKLPSAAIYPGGKFLMQPPKCTNMGFYPDPQSAGLRGRILERYPGFMDFRSG